MEKKSEYCRLFGLAVRHLRKTETSLSQEGFAVKNQIERSYMGSVERGEKNPGLEVVLRISQGLGVPSASIFQLMDEIKEKGLENDPDIAQPMRAGRKHKPQK